MDLAGIDRTLAQLKETVGVMSTNLVDLENDTVRCRLDQAPLTGTTAQRWAEATAATTSLWQWFAALNDILEKATQLRGGPKARLDPAQLKQLDWLVNGPSVELSTSGVPLAERGLFGPAETTSRCSPPGLLDRMRVAFQQVVEMITTSGQRWGALERQLAPLDRQLADAFQLAAVVGDGYRPELDRVRALLEQLRQSVMCDPLGASAGDGDGVAATLAALTADLRRLADLRTGLEDQLAEARTLVGELRATIAAAAEAGTEAERKIARPCLTPPPAVAADIEAALQRVVDASTRGDWRAAANQLALWTTRCRDALAEAQRALAANQAPVAARDELRGRLDAYRAKAYRLGLLEDARVAGLYARAKSVLFTAPTDLAEAEQWVLRYQQALTGPAPREVAT